MVCMTQLGMAAIAPAPRKTLTAFDSGLFSIAADGQLAYRCTHHLRSNDYGFFYQGEAPGRGLLGLPSSAAAHADSGGRAVLAQ